MNHLSVSKKDWVLKTFDENLVQKYCEKFFFDEIVSRLLVIKNSVNVINYNELRN